MTRVVFALWLVLGVVALGPAAGAGEPAVAIAPVPVTAPGSTIPPELQRAFQDELQTALQVAGFLLKPPNEVDMKIAEKPEFIRCTAPACLVEEAAFLGVARLIVPRLGMGPDGELTPGLLLFDVEEKRPLTTVEARCPACTVEKLRDATREAARKLRAGADKHDDALPKEPVRVKSAPPAAHVKTRFRVVKFVLLAAGLAAVAAGAGLWAIDGNGTCTLTGMQKECPRIYDTLPLGAGLVGGGAALVLTSVIMLATDRPVAQPAAVAELRF